MIMNNKRRKAQDCRDKAVKPNSTVLFLSFKNEKGVKWTVEKKIDYQSRIALHYRTNYNVYP